MKPWTSTDIALVYFGGIALAILAAIVVLLCLRPFRKALAGIWGKCSKAGLLSFRSSIMVAGLLGALSVSYVDCSGSYEYLLDSGYSTLAKGLEQIGRAFGLLSVVVGAWLLVLILMHLTNKKRQNNQA